MQNVLHGILETIITCFTYMQFFINWFHCMIQICNENVMLFMLKQFNNPLIQASMVYSSNIIVIPTLFYLLKVILNITTFFFVFLVPPFLIFYLFFWFFLVPCVLIFYLIFWIFLVPCSFTCWYLDILLYCCIFTLTPSFIYQLHLTVFLIPCFLICNVWC